MAGYIGSKAVNLSTTGADINGDANIDGTLTSDGDLSFRDNDKAIFGAGSDLQIYHNGNNSYVQDVGTGKLHITSNGTGVSIDKGTSELMATFDTDGAVTLYYDNAAKLATTSTGVDVTGTITSDGLTVDGVPTTIDDNRIIFNETPAAGSLGSRIVWRNPSTTYDYASIGFDNQAGSSGGLRFKTASSVFSDTDKLRMDIAGNGDISFYEDTGTTAKFFWDASLETLTLGGTEWPSSTIGETAGRHMINYDGEPRLLIWDASTGAAGNEAHIMIGGKPVSSATQFSGATISAGVENGTDADGYLAISTTNSGSTSVEHMRIDSSGNFLVGTTDSTPYNNNAGSSADNGFAYIASSGILSCARYTTSSTSSPFLVNRTGSDGAIAEFRKDGSTVGRIGANSGNVFIYGSSGLRFTANSIVPVNSNGSNSDNDQDLGSSGVRFDDIYATNGTIQTSDRNEKQDIAELSDAEQRVAVAAKGLMRKFRWRDAVEAKGDDARTHFGIIAQDLQAAFAAEGLDAGDYAMFISSTWTDEETGEERTRMGVRYSELLAFIIGAL
jgi:hypothetical protein